MKKKSIRNCACIFLLAVSAYAVIVNVLGIENEPLPIPVKNATSLNWDVKSFWYCSHDKSWLHKGIDIFSPQKTPVVSPVTGIVLSTGNSPNGGNYIYLLGAKSRVYYFAHLNSIDVKALSVVNQLDQLGTVGNTGNALSKPYHLHFSIFSVVPIIKSYDKYADQGWKKMFYVDPNKFLKDKYASREAK